MLVVSDDLLGATIDYLVELKARGVRTVQVAPETLATLAAPPVRAHAPQPAAFAPAPLVAAPVLTAPVARADAPIFNGDARLQAINDLRARVMGCVKCPHLVSSRANVVFGVGNINAELMFVGEAPGADEDRQGEPFVGAAGQLLTKMIQAMGLTRDSVYIANILKCRPDTPGQAYGNRKPTPEEMQTCISWLHEQIDIVRPKVLVGLGATAIEGLLGKTAGIMRLRGQWHTYRDIPLMPTYHPAFLLRNQAVSEKRKVWEDLLQVMEKLGLSITEKQRSYFLKG
jgi:DNA polymerase